MELEEELQDQQDGLGAVLGAVGTALVEVQVVLFGVVVAALAVALEVAA